MAGLLMASAAAGCLSRCVVHPMDTLRSLLMVRAGGGTLRKVATEVVARDGLRGLYRGFGVSVVMQAPAVATYLTTYERAKGAMGGEGAAVHLASGLVAETVSAVFWVPMEVVKQRAMVRGGEMAAASSLVVARDLLAYEGPRALFKGYGLTVGVFGPYSMVYFMAYERFKSACAKRRELGNTAVAGSAAAAGAIAAAVTTPLDVIKTRLQTQGDLRRRVPAGTLEAPATASYEGTWHAARVIAAEEGVRGFLKGISARVLWIMPGTAITMSTFEYLKRRFNLVPPPRA